VQLGVVVLDGEIGVQPDTESSLEEVGMDDDDNQCDAEDIKGRISYWKKEEENRTYVERVK
jgi:hypothetical protein